MRASCTGLPHPDFKRTGGAMNGFQLWVNLPARDKMMKPRYQEIPASRLPVARTPDGLVQVKVIAGETLGVKVRPLLVASVCIVAYYIAQAAIETRTPIIYMHFTLQPGGSTSVAVPPEYQQWRTCLRRGAATTATASCASSKVHSWEVQRATGTFNASLCSHVRLVDGSEVHSVPAGAPSQAQLLLLAGVPLREPVARYGPSL